MSLWIDWPTLVDVEKGEVVFGFKDSHWSLDKAEWVGNAVVRMQLRKYPGAHKPPFFEVTLDCDARTARVQGCVPIEMSKLEATLDDLCKNK